jgi:antitoxin CcdA
MFDPTAPKKNTTVSINSDLLGQARALGLNLSGTLEKRLEELLAEHERAEWLRENEEAIHEYNGRVDQSGAFSDGLRRF